MVAGEAGATAEACTAQRLPGLRRQEPGSHESDLPAPRPEPSTSSAGAARSGFRLITFLQKVVLELTQPWRRGGGGGIFHLLCLSNFKYPESGFFSEFIQFVRLHPCKARPPGGW